MSETLILRTRRDHLKRARDALRARLLPLREEAQRVDNYDPSSRAFDLKLPLNYTSVEALVMDVSDLAQAVGYLDALLEDEA